MTYTKNLIRAAKIEVHDNGLGDLSLGLLLRWMNRQPDYELAFMALPAEFKALTCLAAITQEHIESIPGACEELIPNCLDMANAMIAERFSGEADQ